MLWSVFICFYIIQPSNSCYSNFISNLYDSIHWSCKTYSSHSLVIPYSSIAAITLSSRLFSPFLNVQQPCQNSPETRKPLAILKLEELLSFRKASSPYLDVWVPSVFLEGSKILHFNTRRCKIVNRWFFLQHFSIYLEGSSISRDLFDDQRNLAPTSREKLKLS